jgi:hypothetical protein
LAGVASVRGHLRNRSSAKCARRRLKAVLARGQPLVAPLPAGSLSDAGGLLTLINASQLRVDGVAYASGDPELGSSTSFA